MGWKIIYNDELYHYGVKGMKWGVRKQPEYTGTGRRSSGNSKKMSTAKKIAIGAAVVAGTTLAAYGGYKLYKSGAISKDTLPFIKKGKRAVDYNTNFKSLRTRDGIERAKVSRIHQPVKVKSRAPVQRDINKRATEIWRTMVEENNKKLARVGLPPTSDFEKYRMRGTAKTLARDPYVYYGNTSRLPDGYIKNIVKKSNERRALRKAMSEATSDMAKAYDSYSKASGIKIKDINVEASIKNLDEYTKELLRKNGHKLGF